MRPRSLKLESIDANFSAPAEEGGRALENPLKTNRLDCKVIKMFLYSRYLYDEIAIYA
jgi:hypothetical protein